MPKPHSPANCDTSYDYWLTLLASTDDKETLAHILAALMTDKERTELINRLKIFALIHQGHTQREISSILGVGIATVSRGVKVYEQHRIEALLPHLDAIISA